MEDFKHCVWLMPDEMHPWHGYIDGVPAHLSVKTYLETAAEAEEWLERARPPVVVRFSGDLRQTHTRGFYALEQPVEPVGCAAPPEWWPAGAHVSFGYRYDCPFSDEEVLEVRRRLAAGPDRAAMSRAAHRRCSGHYAGWCTG